MLRKTPAIILAVMLCLLCLHPLAAAAQTGPSADDAQGAWHLVEIVDYENKEAAQKDGEIAVRLSLRPQAIPGRNRLPSGSTTIYLAPRLHGVSRQTLSGAARWLLSGGR